MATRTQAHSAWRLAQHCKAHHTRHARDLSCSTRLGACGTTPATSISMVTFEASKQHATQTSLLIIPQIPCSNHGLAGCSSSSSSPLPSLGCAPVLQDLSTVCTAVPAGPTQITTTIAPPTRAHLQAYIRTRPAQLIGLPIPGKWSMVKHTHTHIWIWTSISATLRNLHHLLQRGITLLFTHVAVRVTRVRPAAAAGLLGMWPAAYIQQKYIREDPNTAPVHLLRLGMLLPMGLGVCVVNDAGVLYIHVPVLPSCQVAAARQAGWLQLVWKR